MKIMTLRLNTSLHIFLIFSLGKIPSSGYFAQISAVRRPRCPFLNASAKNRFSLYFKFENHCVGA